MDMTRKHTVIGAKRVSVAGALPMCCANKTCQLRGSSLIPYSDLLTVIAAYRAGKIWFKIWTWVLIFRLVAVTVEMLVFKFGVGVVQGDLRARIRITSRSARLRLFFALVLILDLLLVFGAF